MFVEWCSAYVNWELINHVNLSICLSILLVSIIYVIKYNYGTGLCMCWYLHPIVYLDSIHSRNCKATKEVIIDMFSWLCKKWIDTSMDPYVRYFKLLYILYIYIKQHIHHFFKYCIYFFLKYNKSTVYHIQASIILIFFKTYTETIQLVQ